MMGFSGFGGSKKWWNYYFIGDICCLHVASWKSGVADDERWKSTRKGNLSSLIRF
jgi:hypothetical protein